MGDSDPWIPNFGPKKGTLQAREANEATPHKLKKVMVFCDGTWCGQLTGSRTNVQILADAIAGKPVTSGEEFVASRDGGIIGCYYNGEGVQGSFSDYLLDGALGGKIKEDCLAAYRFIMEQFEASDGQCEAWLIGLSRGAYTVRCVAGMINNCGLISEGKVAKHLGHGRGHLLKEEMEDIIRRAYFYYRDRTETYLPNGEFMKKWKEDHSREMQRPPVKFMGLFETIGSLGIPSLNPGMGVNYPGALAFYGKADEGASAVSGEVERVYQALAVHDRLTAFSPCHVKRDKHSEDFAYNKVHKLNTAYETEELWFPGAHYDIGRQKFMFYQSPSLLPPDKLSMIRDLEITKLIAEVSRRLVQRSASFGYTRLLRIPDIHPNYVYANAVLTWMTEKMVNTDPDAFSTLRYDASQMEKKDEKESFPQQLFNLLTLKPRPLQNDAYDQLVEKVYLTLGFAPFARRFLVGLFDRYLLWDRTIVDPPDSTEPDIPPAPPVKFHEEYLSVDPEIYLRGNPESYRSRSYDSYMLQRKIQGQGTSEKSWVKETAQNPAGPKKQRKIQGQGNPRKWVR